MWLGPVHIILEYKMSDTTAVATPDSAAQQKANKDFAEALIAATRRQRDMALNAISELEANLSLMQVQAKTLVEAYNENLAQVAKLTQELAAERQITSPLQNKKSKPVAEPLEATHEDSATF